ncbi:hypothetical protein CYMTET_46156 [Cymbomonas tetramitiformis]|uniref:Secreted protein n=1 Tax=Cymbomonas tetramitiformis TaxID=36881 RepID=A0AAE0EXV8_9CHLO|nr:hypothetical protein CYMTET_46156 [Cymbomonas tetramitiformis]
MTNIALVPTLHICSWAFGAVSWTRNLLYTSGVVPTHRVPMSLFAFYTTLPVNQRDESSFCSEFGALSANGGTVGLASARNAD